MKILLRSYIDAKISPTVEKNMINIKDIYWAAGFLEGEGSFVYRKSSSGIVVSAPQKARELLDKLVELFGGNVYGPITTNRNIYQWQICGDKAIGLVMTLYSLMSIKRKGEISKALLRWKSIPLSRQKHIALFGKCKNGHEWTDDNIVIETRSTGVSRRCKTCLQIRSQAYSKTYYRAHSDVIKENAKTNRLKRKLAVGA